MKAFLFGIDICARMPEKYLCFLVDKEERLVPIGSFMKLQVSQILMILLMLFAQGIAFAVTRGACRSATIQHILNNEKGPFKDETYNTIGLKYLRYLQKAFRLDPVQRLIGAKDLEALSIQEMPLIEKALFSETGSSHTMRVLGVQGRSRYIEVSNIRTIKDAIELLQETLLASPYSGENYELVAYSTNNALVRFFIRLSSYRYVDDFDFPQVRELESETKMENSKGETLFYMGTLVRTHSQSYSFPSQKEIKKQRDNYRIKQRFSIIVSPNKDNSNVFDAETTYLVDAEMAEQGIGSLWDRSVSHREVF
ncbi:MAG: hypothetical protein VX642_07130 [Bdellovibrionota bacterium]|nr:hypothetical protein [Bdellovibrionota bacterium]